MGLVKILLVAVFTCVFSLSAHADDKFGYAPDISLRSTLGKSISLSDYRGKVVLINFWATWCKPCLKELPHLQKIYKDLKNENFIVLGINVDEARDISKVKPLTKRYRLEFPILLDPEKTTLSKYNPDLSIPFSVVVDKDGYIYAYFNGYHPGMENEIKKAVEEKLDGAG